MYAGCFDTKMGDQEWCNKLVETLNAAVVVLDACTGTGCIPLLIGHELNNIAPKIYGLDVSGKAFDLANENLSLYKQRYPNNPIDLKFYLGDVFDAEIMDKLGLPKINLLTSILLIFHTMTILNLLTEMVSQNQ